MYKPFIYSLIPSPVNVDTKLIKGKLFIEGNIKYNYIKFRFCFEKTMVTSPLAISVKADNKEYIYNCTALDFENNEARTAVFHPEFCINRQIKIINIEPLITLQTK